MYIPDKTAAKCMIQSGLKFMHISLYLSASYDNCLKIEKNKLY